MASGRCGSLPLQRGMHREPAAQVGRLRRPGTPRPPSGTDTASGNGQCVRCETGGRKLLEALPVRLHKTHRSLADDVFSRIADKSPVHAPVRGAPPTSVRAY